MTPSPGHDLHAAPPRGSDRNGRSVEPNHVALLGADPQALAVVDDVAAALNAELIALRRRLHAEPELSYQEVATTDEVLERLAIAGLHPVRLESGTGLHCDIGTGDGPLVALRADLDALAMPDAKDVAYRSRVAGVAHACGHDVHTSVVLGAGLALHQLAQRGQLPGRIRLLFEPGEERVPGGAVEIIEAGLLEGVRVVFAAHCDPKLDVGVVGTRIGAITSAADRVEITVDGPGGHTARPHLTVDLIDVLALLVRELPVRLTERMGGPQTCRLVFGAIHAGAAANVIPSQGVLTGSLRTPDRAAWQQAPEALQTVLDDLLTGTGAGYELRLVRGVPPVVNDETAARLLARSARSFLGEGAVVETEHSWGGDSFGWMSTTVPGAYARLGTHDPANGARVDLHHSEFDVDERCIGIGVRTLARAALGALAAAR